MLAQVVLYTVVLPAVVSAAALFVAWRFREARRGGGRFGTAAGLGVGYMAGYVGILGVPRFPPLEATQWVFYIAVIALVLGILEPRWQQRRITVWGVRSLLVTVTSWLLLSPLATYSWSAAVSVVWVAGLGTGYLIFWKTQTQLDRYGSTGFHSLLLIVLGATESVVIALSSSVALAQLQGVLTAAVAAAFVVAWRFPRTQTTLATGIPMVTMLFVTHAASGFFFAEMPASSALLLGLAPLGALLAWRGRDRPGPRAAGFLVALVIAAAAIAAAVLQHG